MKLQSIWLVRLYYPFMVCLEGWLQIIEEILFQLSPRYLCSWEYFWVVKRKLILLFKIEGVREWWKGKWFLLWKSRLWKWYRIRLGLRPTCSNAYYFIFLETIIKIIKFSIFFLLLIITGIVTGCGLHQAVKCILIFTFFSIIFLGQSNMPLIQFSI